MKQFKYFILMVICFSFEIGKANANQTVNVPAPFKVNDISLYNMINSTGTNVSVSGADPIQVVVTASSGSIKISSTGGLTATSGYSSSQWGGNNEIAFYGSLASVNNALQTLAYQGSGTITVAASKPDTYFSTSTGNFYYLDTTLGSTWSIAKALATSMTWSGARGYLATITTSAENSLLTTVTNNQNAWIDGSDSGTEGVWLWTNGPEAGAQFSYQANPSVQAGAVATQPGGNFWGPSNPNGGHLGGSGDDCIEFYGFQGTIYSNLWNDLDCVVNTRPFVVEFSGSDVTTALKSFTISALSANPITLADITKSPSDPAFTITNPTSSSTGAFSYTSSNTSVATISGNTVTIQGIGSTTITVTQASDGNYAAATATATLTVGLNSISISLADIDKFVDDLPFNITNPTSSSSGAFSYTSSNTSVATISGNTVTIQGLGTSTITVTQAAAGSYASTTTTATLTVTENLNDPVVAYEAIKTEIESITKNSAISNSVEQVKNAEFIMREKMVFHGEMMRAEPSTATTSFVDYNFNLNGNSFGMVGDGKYHQTDIGGDQFRRRIMIDAKRVHSKNASVTQVVSALSLFDVGISKKTSSQYRFSFKQSNGKGSYPIKSSSKARAYRVGASLSHSFNEKVFGGIFGDLIYTQTKSSFQSTYTNVIGKIRTYSASGGAQLTGQYEVYPEFWIKPTMALSYSREYLIRKRFVSNTSLGSTVVEAALPMPTVFRMTAEPEFLYESFANQGETKDFVSVSPSYACESMESGTKVDACNTGIYLQIGRKNDEKGITGKFYFSYENLNSGPKHEYGLQFKSDF